MEARTSLQGIMRRVMYIYTCRHSKASSFAGPHTPPWLRSEEDRASPDDRNSREEWIVLQKQSSLFGDKRSVVAKREGNGFCLICASLRERVF